jgi:fatty-acyl-CoA synthase
MFHVHAWGFPFLATQYSMKQVYAGKMDPALIARLYQQEKVTISHCVPTILQMVLKCPEAAQMDLSGWKIIIGGAAFPKALAKAALERGMDVMAGYGMSETCPVVATTIIRREDKDRDLDWQVEARTRTGVPAAFVDLKLITSEGKEAGPDDKEQGEIVLRTPWLTQGYVKEPEKGAVLWEGDYLHTGDVATIDLVHSLKIADRIKDVIKSGGEWISSIDLENLIGLFVGVAETAVVGMADPKWGERPYALVVARPGQSLSVLELKKHIQQYIDSGQISKWAMPEQIELVDAIPKTSVGKIDKKKIRERINAL